jgi:hypothetical protein
MPDREELLRQGEAVGRAIRERMAGTICLGDNFSALHNRHAPPRPYRPILNDSTNSPARACSPSVMGGREAAGTSAVGTRGGAAEPHNSITSPAPASLASSGERLRR